MSFKAWLQSIFSTPTKDPDIDLISSMVNVVKVTRACNQDIARFLIKTVLDVTHLRQPHTRLTPKNLSQQMKKHAKKSRLGSRKVRKWVQKQCYTASTIRDNLHKKRRQKGIYLEELAELNEYMEEEYHSFKDLSVPEDLTWLKKDIVEELESAIKTQKTLMRLLEALAPKNEKILDAATDLSLKIFAADYDSLYNNLTTLKNEFSTRKPEF